MFNRKCKIIVVMAVAMALLIVPSALAWHANGVSVTATCGENYTYTVSATIDQSSQWPGATIKSITPASFPGDTSGVKAVVVVIKWPNSNDTQTFNKTVTLDGKCVKPPVDPSCPEGYTAAGKSEGVLLCTKETVRTETVTVVETRYVDVPGPTVEKIVTVEKVVDRPVPGKTIVKIKKVKGKTVYVYRYKIHRVVKKVPVIGVCKYKGHVAVPGAG